MTRFSVEPLPSHPNLEYQHKQAKRLLRRVWDGDAESIARARHFHPHGPDPDSMTLHDAQLIIARGYGFKSWLALTHRIESLTKTPLELFELAVRSGDANSARELLAANQSLRAGINDRRFDFDSPAIHQAKKNLPLVDVLLEFGADINARSSWWAGSFGILEWNLTLAEAQPLIDRGATLTPWAAAIFGMRDELTTHLEANPDLVRERGGDGKTLLHFATTIEIIDLLLDRGAEIDALDSDHRATALQYHIADEMLARRLVGRGAKADIFAAARLGETVLASQCLDADPNLVAARVNLPPFTAPGGHIYGWTLGFDLTPFDVARKFGHDAVVSVLNQRAAPKVRFMDAAWNAEADRAREVLASHPEVISELDANDRRMINAAAWWYRPGALSLMLELGFDPKVRGPHQSTTLDRACFHGYADIVAMLLAQPDPPLTEKNEFGGTPTGAVIYGSLHGWKTGHPQDHALTLQLLLDAGAPIDATVVPTGNDSLDAVLRDWLRTHPEDRDES